MDLTDPVATALLASEAFDRAGLRHALFGGLLLGVYGEVRETSDADLAVLDASAEEARIALAAAGVEALVSFDAVRFGGLTIGRVTLLAGGGHEGLNVVDLVRPRSPRLASAAIERSVTGPLRGQTIRMLTADDFVVFKVLATREKDLDDAASVLRRSPELVDLAAIERECETLAAEIPDHDVRGRLAEVVRRARGPA